MEPLSQEDEIRFEVAAAELPFAYSKVRPQLWTYQSYSEGLSERSFEIEGLSIVSILRLSNCRSLWKMLVLSDYWAGSKLKLKSEKQGRFDPATPSSVSSSRILMSA